MLTIVSGVVKQRHVKLLRVMKHNFQTKAKLIEELKNVAHFSNGCLPAADNGNAQNQQLLLWSKPSELF